MELKSCNAGPTRCKYKANADKFIVCSAPLGVTQINGKNYEVPLDSKGGYCPYFAYIEVNQIGLKEVV